MRTWNKKHKPKHWTKPKWKTKAIEKSKFKIFLLVSRGIKSKYKINYFFYFMNNKPKFEFLSRNKIIVTKENNYVEM